MEKHIKLGIINGLEISQDNLSLFEKETIELYNLVSDMKKNNLSVSIDSVELYAMLRHKSVNISDLNGLEQDIDYEFVLDTYLRDKKREQVAKEIQMLNAEYLNGNNESLDKIRALTENIGINTSIKALPFSSVLEQQLDFIERIHRGEELDGLYLYKKGGHAQFMRLNYKLKLIEKTDLVVLAGRASVGKSSFMLAMANILVKNGYRGLIISLEMPNSQLAHRMTMAKSGITNDVLFNTVTPLSKEMLQGYVTALHQVTSMPLKIVENIPKVWTEIKKVILQEKDNIDFVMIDHLQIIQSYDGTLLNDTNLLISRITSDMKTFSNTHKIPIIVLSQFNRQLARQSGKRVDPLYVEAFMTDLRDSGAIEQDADKIIILYREKDEELENRGVFKTKVKIEKNRGGQKGELDYLFYARFNRWAEVREDKDVDNWKT